MKAYMGCAGEISEVELERYEDTGEWIAEPKRDGIWGVCVSNGSQRFFSRPGKEKEIALPSLPSGTISVGELGYGSQEACLRRDKLGHDFMDVYDLLEVDGRNIESMDDNDRRKLLEDTWSAWTPVLQKHFLLNPRWDSEFRKHYEEVPEGLILKRVKGRPEHPYRRGTRNPYWVKVKKQFTVDMVIMDYELSDADSYKGKNIAKNIGCGVFKDGKLVKLVNVGNFDVRLKLDIVAKWSQYKGAVVELKTYKVFKSGSLRHPSVVRVRDDKLPEECVWEDLMKFV